MNQADYDAISYEQLLDELNLLDLAQVVELALEGLDDLENSADLALKAIDRLAARMAARNLQRSAQDLFSLPRRFSA